MAEILNGIEEINLDYHEYCILTDDVAQDAETFKVHIPKIMPAIERNPARTWAEKIDSKIFVNAEECKVKHSPEITCQNFKTIKNRSYKEPKVVASGNTVTVGDVKITVTASYSSISISAAKQKVTLKKGTKCILQSMYGNINDSYIVDVSL